MEAVTLIEDASNWGVDHFVCGFLPDEADGLEKLAHFIERFEFSPFRFGSDRATRENGSHIFAPVAVFDTRDLAAEALAVSCSRAIGKEASFVSLGRAELDGISEKIACASLVINAAADWTLGFAVDELAARLAIPVVRLWNPGYSLLRYAPLGIQLPPEKLEEVPQLRAALAQTGWIKRGRDPCVPKSVGITGMGAALCDWFGAQAVALPWSNVELKRLAAMRTNQPARWLNRVLAWSGLTAAFTPNQLSAEARKFLGATLARWVVREQKLGITGAVREAALARWVRAFPEWLGAYRLEAAAEGVEAARHVARWVITSVTESGAPLPTLDLVFAARRELDASESGGKSIEVALAWRERWRDLPGLLTSRKPLAPLVRAVCAHFASQRIRELASASARPEGRRIEERDPALDNEPAWRISMGAAGLCLQLGAALACHRRDVALRSARQLYREAGVRSQGGLARLFRRAGLLREDAFCEWTAAIARKPETAPHVVLNELASQWLQTNGWYLWKQRRERQLERELEVALAILEDLARIGRLLRTAGSTYVLVAGLAGAEESAIRGLSGLPEPDRWTAGLVGRVAVALWLRGRCHAARALLESQRPSDAAPVAAWFTSAVAWQLLDCSERAEAALERMQAMAPGYLTDRRGPDLRWSLAALVCHRSGLDFQAKYLRDVSRVVLPNSEHLFADVDAGKQLLADGWRPLLETACNRGQ
ncbi:MAG: hypothetical protein ACREIA_08235 [Opitutaceae bacterium]